MGTEKVKGECYYTKEWRKIHKAKHDEERCAEAVLSFMCAYQKHFHEDVTYSTIKMSGVVHKHQILPALRKLKREEWITSWNNGYDHYHAKTIS